MRIFIEIACFNSESAITAISAGADRIELCRSRATGGVSPSLSTLLEIKSGIRSQSVSEVPVMVMIRPRDGDFIYSSQELEDMKSTIQTFKPHCSGFVFGVLTPSQTVDLRANTDLVNLALPLPCTFHRAFDDTLDLDQALNDVMSCGFSNILTSGGPGNAPDNREVLAKLVMAADGNFAVMLGGGVRSANVEVLHRETGAIWFHSSAIVGESENASREEILRLCAIKST